MGSPDGVQLSSGLGGRLPSDEVAALHRIGWQESPEYAHHPGGSQAAFLTGLAHLYNLIPYQRRALNAGQCGVEVEGGVLPTTDWMLNLQILTSGGFR